MGGVDGTPGRRAPRWHAARLEEAPLSACL